MLIFEDSPSKHMNDLSRCSRWSGNQAGMVGYWATPVRMQEGETMGNVQQVEGGIGCPEGAENWAIGDGIQKLKVQLKQKVVKHEETGRQSC